MAAPKANKLERARRLRRVEQLYARGVYQHVIADQLGVTQQQVSYDLAIVRRRYLAQAVQSRRRALARELARLDEVEREAWEQWERSKLPFRKEVAESGAAGAAARNKAAITTEDRCGDPRYLVVIAKCVEQRSRLLALDDLAADRRGPAERRVVGFFVETGSPAAAASPEVQDAAALPAPPDPPA